MSNNCELYEFDYSFISELRNWVSHDESEHAGWSKDRTLETYRCVLGKYDENLAKAAFGIFEKTFSSEHDFRVEGKMRRLSLHLVRLAI